MNADGSPPSSHVATILDESDLRQAVQAALADPQWQGHPLAELLHALHSHSESQRQRLERLVRISDGYHQVTRSQTHTLTQQYDRQLRRLEKLARISDRYQNSLREMSEALREAALHDQLTGLPNRRLLMERLRQETERATRHGEPYSVAILDLDHFKAVNDRYGHDVGDKALERIAVALQASVREYDLCGRWGGEEFLILLPATALDAAHLVTERVRQAVQAIELQVTGSVLRFTASQGLTQYRPGETSSETVNRADDALYAAKAAGRNCIHQA